MSIPLSLMSRVLGCRFIIKDVTVYRCIHLISTLTSLPVRAAEKHPHSIILPPPCFTVGIVLGRWWAVLVSYWRFAFRPKSSIFVFIRPKSFVLMVWEFFRCCRNDCPSGRFSSLTVALLTRLRLARPPELGSPVVPCKWPASLLIGTFSVPFPTFAPLYNPVSEVYMRSDMRCPLWDLI